LVAESKPGKNAAERSVCSRVQKRGITGVASYSLQITYDQTLEQENKRAPRGEATEFL
jgi:hypothetical protein